VPSILFLHENYPAQFGALADYLAGTGWQVVFGTQKEGLDPGSTKHLASGVRVVRYARARDPNVETHPYLQGTERAILNGQGFARLGISLKNAGFMPDIIVAHSGWGSGSFAKVVFPEARLVQYLEWWYRYPPVDAIPDLPSQRPAEDQHARALTRNLPFFLDFQQADLLVTPTEFQASQFPDFMKSRLVVQHDGVDFDLLAGAVDAGDPFSAEGLPEDAPVVTFATRGMEPTRGFPTFMAAAARVQGARPDAHIVVAGNDTIHYGPKPNGFQSWKEKALAEHEFAQDRLHFTGLLQKPEYAKLLRRTNAHAYLTLPFVLSWSMIEAMGAGAPIVASDVAPVREVLEADTFAKFVPTQDVEALTQALLWCLENPDAARNMGARAQAHAMTRYDRATCHAAWARLLNDLLEPQTE